MDNSANRGLYLNFGQNNPNEGRLQANNDRTYPTTPSTFPQPVFGAGPGQGQNSAGQYSSQQGQQQYQQGYVQQGYYNQQHGQQQYAAPQYNTSVQDYASGGQNQTSPYGQARSNTPGTNNDPNTGLAHQFSHQNLGGAARNSPYGVRGAPQGQRPRTAGTPGQQQSNYGSYLNAPMPTPSQQATPQFEFQAAPERNPEKYGPNAHNNTKKCSQLAADFFKDSVKRARERNQR